MLSANYHFEDHSTSFTVLRLFYLKSLLYRPLSELSLHYHISQLTSNLHNLRIMAKDQLFFNQVKQLWSQELIQNALELATLSLSFD